MLLHYSKAQQNSKRFFNQQIKRKKFKGNHDFFVLFKILNLQWFRYIIMVWNMRDYNILEVALYNIAKVL